MTPRSIAKWLILSFAIGLVAGKLLISGQNGATDTAIVTSNSSLAIEPVANASLSNGPATGNQSLNPLLAVARAAEAPRVDPVRAVPAPLPAAQQRSTARSTTLTRLTTPRATLTARPTAANLPRYRGALVIDSTPSGAVVSVDGRIIGATPIVLQDVRAGSRVVRVEARGYERWSAAARVVADRKTRVTATLQPRSKP